MKGGLEGEENEIRNQMQNCVITYNNISAEMASILQHLLDALVNPRHNHDRVRAQIKHVKDLYATHKLQTQRLREMICDGELLRLREEGVISSHVKDMLSEESLSDDPGAMGFDAVRNCVVVSDAGLIVGEQRPDESMLLREASNNLGALLETGNVGINEMGDFFRPTGMELAPKDIFTILPTHKKKLYVYVDGTELLVYNRTTSGEFLGTLPVIIGSLVWTPIVLLMQGFVPIAEKLPEVQKIVARQQSCALL